MSRKAGILLPVSSLAGDYGIGDFGPAAYAFIDEMACACFHIWQILPLNPIGYGNSPYQPYSSFAGEEIYISLERLKDMGLIKHIKHYGEKRDSIQYERVREFKMVYFKEAYEAFKLDKQLQKEFESFEATTTWLEDYAIFITLKKVNGGNCWLDWQRDHKRWIEDKAFDIQVYNSEIAYEKFVQFIFFKQWFELKAYANDREIDVMGDIPIYVGIDSVDVWSNKNCFLLTKEGKPRFIAGVPPDYFSKTGQRWGNPIYDWEYLSQTKFKFWIDRLAWNHALFDIIRIDHFRGFDTYWKIPASFPTAVEGIWMEAPGYALFDEIYKQLPDIKIIAEDLGDLRPEVLALRDYYHLSGMKILQFELDPKESNNDFEETLSTIVYTGTHDNQTLKGWYQSLSCWQKRNIAKKFPTREYGGILSRILQSCFASKANVVIFPLQDLLRLDDCARLNTPGSIGSPNWEWKLKRQYQVKAIQTYKHHIQKNNRQ